MHALRMAMRGIDHDHVHAGIDQGRDALLGVAADANRGADQQALVAILGGVRVVAGLLDVLDGDQSAQLVVVVDDQNLFDAELVQQLQHFVLAGALTHRHQLVLAGHDVAHRIFVLALETQVAAGDDADQLLVLDHRYAGDVVGAGETAALHRSRSADRP